MAATAGPNGAVFFNLHGMGSFAGTFVGSVAVGRVLALPTGAEIEGLSGLGVNFEGKGLPTHGIIIQQALEIERGSWDEVESVRIR